MEMDMSGLRASVDGSSASWAPLYRLRHRSRNSRAREVAAEVAAEDACTRSWRRSYGADRIGVPRDIESIEASIACTLAPVRGPTQ
jgi:hypothetical protein